MSISDVILVVLSDLIVFLTDTNRKLSFFSHDNKVCVSVSGYCDDTEWCYLLPRVYISHYL